MLSALKLEDTPIELNDDGLRLRRNEILHIGKRQTNPEGFRIVAYENPVHTAYAIAVKKERQLIQAENRRKYEDFSHAE